MFVYICLGRYYQDFYFHTVILHMRKQEIPSETLFNKKLNTRLIMINLNPDLIMKEHNFLLSQTSKKFRMFHPVDQVWIPNYHNGDKWAKGAIISRTGTVMYKVKYDNYIPSAVLINYQFVFCCSTYVQVNSLNCSPVF